RAAEFATRPCGGRCVCRRQFQALEMMARSWVQRIHPADAKDTRIVPQHCLAGLPGPMTTLALNLTGNRIADTRKAMVVSNASSHRCRRIVLTTFGSLGDLHPYIAIALGLQARGHEAVLATSAYYREKIERLGIGFRPVRPDFPDIDKFPEIAR